MHAFVVGIEAVEISPGFKLPTCCLGPVGERIRPFDDAQQVRVHGLHNIGEHRATFAVLAILFISFVRLFRSAVRVKQLLHPLYVVHGQLKSHMTSLVSPIGDSQRSKTMVSRASGAIVSSLSRVQLLSQ